MVNVMYFIDKLRFDSNTLEYTNAVVPNLGSMGLLVVHIRYMGVHRIRNLVLR